MKCVQLVAGYLHYYSTCVLVIFCLLQLTPVNSTVGLIEATDVDSQPLYYRLESATVRTHPVLLTYPAVLDCTVVQFFKNSNTEPSTVSLEKTSIIHKHWHYC